MSDNLIDPDVLDSGKFGFNRIIAFLGPYIAIGSGAVADWLLVHVHLLATFHIGKTSVSGAITQVVVFGVAALITWAGHSKWLTGHQNWESLVMRLLIAQTNANASGAPIGAVPGPDAQDVPEAQPTHPDGDVYDPAEFGPQGGIGGKVEGHKF